MTGIDLSQTMIEIAKSTEDSGDSILIFEVADIRNYVPDHTYDAVISMFHVMSYQKS